MDVKIIKSNKIARLLIKNDFKVIDIKQHKNDYKRTVFVFQLTEKLKDFILNHNLEV